MSAFTEAELGYLQGERRLGRIATVGRDGTPHVVPVGWSYNPEQDTIDVGGRTLEQTKKYRDVLRTGRAAIVIVGDAAEISEQVKQYSEVIELYDTEGKRKTEGSKQKGEGSEL